MFSLCNILNYFPCMQSNRLGLFVYSVFLPFWQVSFSVCALVIDCCNCCLHIKRITHLLQVLTVFPCMFSICFLTCHKALLFSSSICRTLVSSFFLANFSSWPVSGPCFSLPIQFALHLAVPNDSFVKYIYSPFVMGRSRAFFEQLFLPVSSSCLAASQPFPSFYKNCYIAFIL